MRYNITAWNQVTGELLLDTWQPADIEDAKKILENIKKLGVRGIVVDWATGKVVIELKANEIRVYPDTYWNNDKRPPEIDTLINNSWN